MSSPGLAMPVPASPERVNVLRAGLVAELRALNALRTDAVEQAFRAVERHVFVPEQTLEQAYEAERALVTRRDADGVALSSVSAARIQAFMLEQADIQPGMRVLEIGSSGYNAALIAELVGDSGEVTTLDIDPDVVDRARRLLPAAGYEKVRVVLADGADGEPNFAPYDRIVVTVEAADLASAWVDQLAESGRIVVPLRVRGLTRSIVFERHDGHLVGRDYEVCGFVPMRGAGARPQRLVVLHDDENGQVGLRIEDDACTDEPDQRGTHPWQQAWATALATPRSEAWSGVVMSRGLPYDDLDLWLATTLPSYALLAATREARDNGVVASWSPMGISTLIDAASGSFAYLAIRPTDDTRSMYEFGAIGHGAAATPVAERLAAAIRTWDRRHRHERAAFGAYPRGTPDEQLPAGCVLDRSDFRLTITWPSL